MRLGQLVGRSTSSSTWHRWTEQPFGDGDWEVANFHLTLWRVDGEALVTLLGDDGRLYITGLEPGQYVIELERVDAIARMTTEHEGPCAAGATLRIWRVEPMREPSPRPES